MCKVYIDDVMLCDDIFCKSILMMIVFYDVLYSDVFCCILLHFILILFYD